MKLIGTPRRARPSNPKHMQREGETTMKLAKLGLGLLVLAMAIVTGATAKNATAQAAGVQAAPVPSVILNAKKVFIANTTGEMALPPGDPDQTYNEFYAAMKSWGRYELVNSPADADMVLQVQFASAYILQASTQWGTDYELRLRIVDSKSGIVLWAFTESISQSSNKTKAQAYFEQALMRLVDDLKNLASRGAPNP